MGGISDARHVRAHVEPYGTNNESDAAAARARWFAWREGQQEERHLRREQSGKTVCRLALAEGLLAFIVMAYVVADHRGDAHSWLRSPVEARTISAAVELMPELPALSLAEWSETRASGALEPAQATREQRADRAAGDRHLQVLSEAVSTDGVMERDVVAETGEGATYHSRGERDLLAGRPRRIEPEQIQSLSTPATGDSTLVLVAASPLMEGAEAEQPPRLRMETLRLKYPRDARAHGVEGIVMLHFYVDEDGRISAVRVLNPVHPSLEKAAVDALYAARFTPGRDSNRNVGSFAQLGIRFTLR